MSFFCLSIVCALLHTSMLIPGQNEPEPMHGNAKSINSAIVSIQNNMDTLNDDVSQIRYHVESISHNTETCIDKSRKSDKRNNTEYQMETLLTIAGLALSIINIVAVVFIYVKTQKKTEKQIKNQHEDTLRQIESQERSIKRQISEQHKDMERQLNQQYKLSKEQINKMQEHSDKRIDSIQALGQQIQTSTGEIRNAVVHLESRFVTERDKARLTTLYSSVIENYEALCLELETNYDHFINNSINGSVYQNASRIKNSIRIISQILSSYSIKVNIPDAQYYINAMNEVVNGPELYNKRNQIDTLKNAGQEYNKQLENCIHII